jgi:3-oxosteroid 1-dehydrogenase
MVWIPDNPHMKDLGIDDSTENALTYLRSLSLGSIDEAAAERFVETGPVMVEWMEAHTPLAFDVLQGFPDYHPENPGSKPRGGRSMECPLFPFSEPGEWGPRVTTGPPLSGALTIAETPLGRGAPDGIPAEEMARRAEHDERGTGQALVGRLLKGVLDRGVVPETGMRNGSRRRGRPGGGRAPRHRRRDTRGAGTAWGGARHRWVRVGPRTGAHVPARTAHPPRVADVQHR